LKLIGCESANRAQKFGVAVAVCPIVTHDFKSAWLLISNNPNWRRKSALA